MEPKTYLTHASELWQPIQEIKKRYRGHSSVFSCRLCSLESYICDAGRIEYSAVLYYEMPDGYEDKELGIYIPKHSVTFAYYWTDRPYNLYHWLSPEGSSLGYYFNVCDQVSLTKEEVSWRDLIIDVYTSGSQNHGVTENSTNRKLQVEVLDEHEIPDDTEPDMLCYMMNSKMRILEEYQDVLNVCSTQSRTLWNMGC